MAELNEMHEIRMAYQGLETLYQTYLSKVDPVLIHDLLVRENEKSERSPFTWLKYLQKKEQIQNGVKIIYIKRLALFQQYMIKALIM